MDAVQTYKQVLSGKLAKFPWRFWDGRKGKSRAKKILKYLRERLGVPVSEVPRVFTTRFLARHRLSGLMQGVFSKSTVKMLKQTWPGKFREWELPGKNKWTGKKGKKLAIKATKNLFKKLGIPKTKIAEYASGNLFQDYGLSGMLKWVYGNSVYLAINSAYPSISWEDLRHNIRADQKYVSNHGHVHKSMFERRIDDYIGDLGLEHEHSVKYPKSNLDCDIVVECKTSSSRTTSLIRSKERRHPKGLSTKLWIECVGMMHLESYRKKMEKKRKIVRKRGLRLVELYLKDDWIEIQKKLKSGMYKKRLD